MKKIFLFSLLTLSGLSLKAQTINNIPINDIKVEYIKIVAERIPLSSQEDIALDFGQESSIWKSGTKTIRDEKGKEIDFNSAMDALNFMGKFGFELVSSYGVHRDNASDTKFYYIMRKKKG